MRHIGCLALYGSAFSFLTVAACGDETASAPHPPEAVPPLAYRWKAGDEYTYKIAIKADVGKRVSRVNAECTYVVKELEVQPPAEQTAASATAFVVTHDGYLLTCDHVVERARQVKVSLGGRRYTADVVDTDLDRDLALIKIPAADLDPIALADSDAVEKGVDVRAVGFPLSDVLGRDLKITRGTVAGIVEEKENRRFYIDAAVNPGNSGGPLVDSQGRAVGVVNAKLMGMAVSQVGFAVPSKEARRLLERNGIRLPAPAPGNDLTGPALFALVAPSVAFVERSGVEDRRWLQLDFSLQQDGYMNIFTPGLAIHSRLAKPKSYKGRMTVSEFGDVTGFNGDQNLNFLLGPLPRLAIETLDSRGRSEWGDERYTHLQVPNETEDYRVYSMSKKVYPAIERVRYSVKDENSDRVVITKTYEFRTLDDATNPYLVSKGSGEIVFDKEFGMPTSLDYRGLFYTVVDNATVRIPVNVSYHMRDPAEVAEERRQKELERKKAEEELKREATIPEPERVAALVADIEGTEEVKLGPLLDELGRRAVIPELREEVTDAVRRIIDGGSRFHRDAAVKVLCRWADEGQMPLLIELLGSGAGGTFGNTEMIRTLEQFSTPEAIRAIASRLAYTFEAHTARVVLCKIGSEAEDAVLEVLLDDRQDDTRKGHSVRKAAAAVLREIGTTKSIEPLEKVLLDERDRWTRDAIANAREKIIERFPKEGEDPAP